MLYCTSNSKPHTPPPDFILSLLVLFEWAAVINFHSNDDFSQSVCCVPAGDAIAPGDVLCDIQTDKAIVGMEYDEEGILAKIIVSHTTIQASRVAILI